MSSLNLVNTAAPRGLAVPPAALPPHWPSLIPMGRAPALSGMSRSALYRAAAAGEITVRKLGRSSLVDAASLAAFIARLPHARIGEGAE